MLGNYTIDKITLTGAKAKSRVSGKIKPRTVYKTVDLPKVKGSPHVWPDSMAPFGQSAYISLSVSKKAAKTIDFEFMRWDGIRGALFGKRKSLCQVRSHCSPGKGRIIF